MAQLHELDRINHIGDWRDDLNRELTGFGFVASVIRRQRTLLGLGNPETLLSLGAGQAYPELELADTLAIPHRNIVLLDRYFSFKARDRLAKVAPEATLIESGLYSYLTSVNVGRFSVVTGFGLHDVLAANESLEEFLRILPRVLDNSGIAFLPHLHPDKTIIPAAARHGLTPVLGSQYFFTPFHAPIAEI